jgi:adenosylhomocysteine nucleosidase
MGRVDGPLAEVNIGVLATNDGVANVGTAIGKVSGSEAAQGTHRRHDRDPFDVGILTVLTEEMQAVVQRLQRYPKYRCVGLEGGAHAYVASVPTDDAGDLQVVALQTLEQGSRSASAAYHLLRNEFKPRAVLLVGIAGGIRDDVAIGDVVLGDQVVYYDARRETPDGPRRRGQSQPMTPFMLHRLNTFFLRYGNSLPMETTGAVRVLRGPVGSGDAVITHEASEIIRWLRAFHEKTLAVETEAGAVGQAFYEEVDTDKTLLGWLTIRGITDHADQHDWQDRRSYASERAALVMDRLLPLLRSPSDL